MKKKCVKCKIEKDISEFSFRKDTNKYRNECKICCVIQKREYAKKNPTKITFNSIKKRCNNKKTTHYHRYGGRGIKCLITEEELRFLWERDRASDMKRPSIDRIDNDGNYCLENCRYIELVENICKENIKKRKIVLQYDLNDNFIQEWESRFKIIKTLNINPQRCLQNKRHSCGGFKWRYK